MAFVTKAEAENFNSKVEGITTQFTDKTNNVSTQSQNTENSSDEGDFSKIIFGPTAAVILAFLQIMNNDLYLSEIESKLTQNQIVMQVTAAEFSATSVVKSAEDEASSLRWQGATAIAAGGVTAGSAVAGILGTQSLTKETTELNNQISVNQKYKAAFDQQITSPEAAQFSSTDPQVQAANNRAPDKLTDIENLMRDNYGTKTLDVDPVNNEQIINQTDRETIALMDKEQAQKAWERSVDQEKTLELKLSNKFQEISNKKQTISSISQFVSQATQGSGNIGASYAVVDKGAQDSAKVLEDTISQMAAGGTDANRQLAQQNIQQAQEIVSMLQQIAQSNHVQG